MNYSKNPLKIILHDLYNFLGITDHVNCQVIKKSNREGYNFSFIVDLKAWSKFIILPQVSEDRNILNYSSDLMDMDERLSELVTISKDWIFHVSRAIIEKNKCLLYLDRTQFFKTLLYEIQVNQPHYGQFIGLKEIVNLQKDDIHLNNLTDHRLTLIHRVTNNLLKYSKFVNSDQQNANLKFLLTTKSNPKKGDPTVRRIACGVVFNHMHGNVVPTLTQDEYFKKKSLDIELILIHKYGVRVKDEKAFQDLIESLARAHVTVDLIEKKMTSTLNLNLNITGSESSKGASFILYNSARLESMLKKFDEQIRKGYYSKLPDIDSVDFAHLKEEEEFQLAFNFLFMFPNLIERTEINDLIQCKLNMHYICSFLLEFSRLFSIYYRRVKLLTENRSQMMPVLFAKIHLMKCIQTVFNKTLRILDIEPVPQL